MFHAVPAITPSQAAEMEREGREHIINLRKTSDGLHTPLCPSSMATSPTKEAGKYSHYSEQPCTHLTTRDSITTGERENGFGGITRKLSHTIPK